LCAPRELKSKGIAKHGKKHFFFLNLLEYDKSEQKELKATENEASRGWAGWALSKRGWNAGMMLCWDCVGVPWGRN